MLPRMGSRELGAGGFFRLSRIDAKNALELVSRGDAERGRGTKLERVWNVCLEGEPFSFPMSAILLRVSVPPRDPSSLATALFLVRSAFLRRCHSTRIR